MVLLAAFLDAVDGRVARLLKSTTKFGAQMDSLADIVNFGVAPALVLYAYLASAYTLLIALLLVSRVPVYSGKTLGQRIRRDLVFPIMLIVVLYVAVLMTFTWETMTATTVLYLLSLPFGARAWGRRYGAESEVGESENSD